MWRFGPGPVPQHFASRMLQAVEHGVGLPTFPTWRDIWHCDDKAAQAYLLPAAGIPIPETTVLWDKQAALAHCRGRRYPFVFKLGHGGRSSNVALVHGFDEAAYYIEQMFGPGLTNLGYRPAPPARLWLRRLRAAGELLAGRHPNAPTHLAALDHGFFLAQEFLPDNRFDTRITVIGRRAYGFRRFNRPDDFRASGSGRIDWAPDAVDQRFVRLAFDVARKLGTTAVGIDGLYRGDEIVICELALPFAAWAIRECPGHWVLRGDPADGSLEWREGRLLAEDAIFADFVARLNG